MKSVIILGSTGSIGKNTLSLIAKDRENFKVKGLSTFGNVKLLDKQIKQFRPQFVAVADKKACSRIYAGGVKVLGGPEGVNTLSSMECDILVLAISGLSALKPLINCLGKAKKLLLANKEAVVASGKILMNKIRKSTTQLLPVDSEANAMFQLLNKVNKENIEKLYITASGGPFLRSDTPRMRRASVTEVLSHPVWKMGKRITVDSATLINKGFEVMEISSMFDIPAAKIEVLVHPQCLVHSLLATCDRRFFASLFFPNMKVPISYALYYPSLGPRLTSLDLGSIKRLEFEKPNLKKFPAFKLALQVAKAGGSLPAVLVASDEVAVDLYLRGKIRFDHIYQLIARVLSVHKRRKIKTLKEVFIYSQWAKQETHRLAQKYYN